MNMGWIAVFGFIFEKSGMLYPFMSILLGAINSNT